MGSSLNKIFLKNRVILFILLLVGINQIFNNACSNLGNLNITKSNSSQSSSSQTQSTLSLSKSSISSMLSSDPTDLSTIVTSGRPPYTYTVTSGDPLVMTGSLFNPTKVGSYTISIKDSAGIIGVLVANVVDSSVSYNFSNNTLTGLVNGISNNQLLQYSRNDGNQAVASYTDAAGIVKYATPGQPRFGINGQGLFIERGSQNLVLTSQDFSTNWVFGSLDTTIMQVFPNLSIAPDNSQTGDDVDLQAVMGTFLNSNATVAPAAQMYTGSVWAKKRVATAQSLTLRLPGTNAAAAGFALTDNWVRYSISGLATAGANVGLSIDNDINGNELVNYSLWGTQVEVGNRASRYIPTNGSSVSRGADVAKITNLSQFKSYGTIYLEFVATELPQGQDSFVFGLSNGEFSGSILDGIYILGLGSNNTTIVREISGGISTDSAGANLGAWTIGSIYKIALSYGPTGISFYQNGQFAGSIAGVTLPTITTLTLGYSGGHGPNSYANSYIRGFRYYPLEGTQKDLERLTK